MPISRFIMKILLVCVSLAFISMGDVLSDLRPQIYKTATKFQVDPILMEAIMRHESANGKSKAARNYNNLGGFMSKGRLKRFPSKESSVEYMGEVLWKYKLRGLTSIDKISTRYCTAPYRGAWRRHVRTFYASVQSGRWGTLPSPTVPPKKPARKGWF